MRELRSFGITLGIFFGALGGLLFWRAKDPFLFLSLSAIFLIFGIARPSLLRPVHTIWMALARAMGWVMTRVILSLLFYGLITPISFLARLFGKQFLNRGPAAGAQSYWIKRTGPLKKERFEAQF